jgi:isocitrate/isopropylmalate dehydrogenase
MLKHLKLSGPANSISKAVDLAIQNRKGTRDIFPESNYTTSDVGKYIADNIN